MEIELHGNRLRVYKDSAIEKFKIYKDSSKNCWKIAKQSTDTGGYKYFALYCDGEYKNYLVHRVVGFVYLVFNINDPKIQIDHVDRNRSNNNINNLRLSDPFANSQNTNAIGCSWDKTAQKWKAEICVNHKSIYLGLFINKEDAHQAYLDAKKIYHVLNN